MIYPYCEEPGCSEPATFNREVQVFRMIRYKWICEKHHETGDERILPEPGEFDEPPEGYHDEPEARPFSKDGITYG